jgi:hypothetical protein
MNTPDPKWHFRISVIKSILRIGAGLYLLWGGLYGAGSLVIASEILGIVEELV